MARRSPFVYRKGWGRSAASVRQREQRQRRQRWQAENSQSVVLAQPTNLTVEEV